jgi:hypothetical protein
MYTLDDVSFDDYCSSEKMPEMSRNNAFRRSSQFDIKNQHLVSHRALLRYSNAGYLRLALWYSGYSLVGDYHRSGGTNHLRGVSSSETY